MAHYCTYTSYNTSYLAHYLPHSVIAFALKMLSFLLPNCDLSPYELYCQSSASVTVKSIKPNSLFIIYVVLY